MVIIHDSAPIQPQNLRGLSRGDMPKVCEPTVLYIEPFDTSFDRYIKAFFDTGELQSPRASNAREECKKVRGVSRFVTQACKIFFYFPSLRLMAISDDEYETLRACRDKNMHISNQRNTEYKNVHLESM